MLSVPVPLAKVNNLTKIFYIALRQKNDKLPLVVFLVLLQ